MRDHISVADIIYLYMAEILDGKYTLGKLLGKGEYSKVRIGNDAEGHKYAIKLIYKEGSSLDERFLKLINAEVSTLKKLSHPNIVNMKDYNESGVVVSASTKANVLYMALELVTNGELFDYIASTGRFSEPMCRLYFNELCSVLQYIHKQGICHRDLKAENIMLDNEYRLKLLDFGFSALKSGKDGSGMLHSFLGTQTYMAPEILAQHPYSGEGVDVFATGVLLFIMLTGRPPFIQAKPSDPIYKNIATKTYEKFWAFHAKSMPDKEKFFSEDFKSLVNSMLCMDPKGRITLDEAIAHVWSKGSSIAHDARKAEFAKRQSILNEIAERNSKIDSNPTIVTGAVGPFRPDYDHLLIACEKMPLKKFYKYDNSISSPCNFYSKYNPNFIMAKLNESVTKLLHPIELVVSENKYKLTATLTGELKKYQIVFKISKPEKYYYIEVCKSREGEKSDFLSVYSMIFSPNNKESASFLRCLI
jgi:serine/threonine protein kinase